MSPFVHLSDQHLIFANALTVVLNLKLDLVTLDLVTLTL